jgi:large subunit ribosomal protein L30
MVKQMATKKAAASAEKKTLTVVQIGSVTNTTARMRQTLTGLGLGKPRASRVLEDTSAVRGMIRKVRHLVKVEGEK